MIDLRKRKKYNPVMFAVWMLVAWLMPQNLFSDCIHAVLPDQAGKHDPLLEQVCEEGFSPENSELKIVWKFMGNN